MLRLSTCTRVHRNNGHRRTRSDEVVASVGYGWKHCIKKPVEVCDDMMMMVHQQIRLRVRCKPDAETGHTSRGTVRIDLQAVPSHECITSRSLQYLQLVFCTRSGDNTGSRHPDDAGRGRCIQVETPSTQSSGEAPAFNPKFSSPGYYSDEEGNQRLILLVERVAASRIIACSFH
jgi:hypothetical protein